MSYTKQTFKTVIEKNKKIQSDTMDDNDLTSILVSLNSVMDVAENFSNKDSDISFYWNEIVSELIAVIHASISGYNRLALSGLRNILELSCHAFYYYDHKIELKIAQTQNSKANKYVSTLIRDDSFFTGRYISAFDNKNHKELKENGLSDFLKSEYSHLCDVVHGRNSTLFKTNDYSISYKKTEFKTFEKRYMNISSIIASMYILRFDDVISEEVEKLSRENNLIGKCK